MSNGNVLYGLEYVKEFNLEFPFTQQMDDIPTAVPIATQTSPTAGTNVAPNDSKSSLVKQYDVAAIQAALDAYKLVVPGKINLDFPRVLLDISVVQESQFGQGANDPFFEAAIGGDSTARYSLEGQLDVQVSASGAMLQDLVFDWLEVDGRDRDCTHFICFIPVTAGVVAQADVLAKIQGLQAAWNALIYTWPKFNPESHTIVVTGNSANLRVGARATSYYSQTDDADTTVSEVSTDTPQFISKSVSVKSITIPPCIHGDLDIGTSPLSQDIAVEAGLDIEPGGTGLPAATIVAADNALTATVSSQLSPTSLAATAGASSIPDTGFYIKDLSIEPYGFGYVMITGTVFDFSTL